MLSVAGAVAAVTYFTANDQATQDRDAVEASAPGRSYDGPKTGGLSEALRAGNVVLLHDHENPSERRSLEALAADLGARDLPALRAAGQAVIVQPGTDGGAITARSSRAELIVQSPADPALRRFVEYWLGRPG